MNSLITLALIFLSTIAFASPVKTPNERLCDPKDAACVPAKSESPFAGAGMKQGDILISVNGIKLSDAGKSLEAFRALNDPKRSVIRVVRDGKEQTIIREPK